MILSRQKNQSVLESDMTKNRTLTRFVVFFLGCLLFFLNQRWIFLHDTHCDYRKVFLWPYLETLPELLAYAVSLLVNLLAAWLALQGIFPKQAADPVKNRPGSRN